MKVLKGSHKLGRIEHKRVGEQMGADTERVEQVMKVSCVMLARLNATGMYMLNMQILPLVEVELEPGDALFFHCNVLHRSDQNKSDNRRWAFLISYNRATSDPVVKGPHPNYTKLHLVTLIISILAN